MTTSTADKCTSLVRDRHSHGWHHSFSVTLLHMKQRRSSVEIDFFESKSRQQAHDRGTCVLLRGAQYAILERGFLQLVLGLLAHTAFEIGIYWHQQSSLPGVYASFVTVQPSGKKL